MSRFSKFFFACCCCLVLSTSVLADRGSDDRGSDDRIETNRGRGRQVSACVKDASDVRKSCEAECKVDFQQAIGQCTDRDPSCVRGCRRSFRACVNTARVPLEACKDACEPALRAAKAQCRVDCNCRGSACEKSLCYRTCQAPALLTAFTCKQGCRDTFALDSAAQAALQACADTRETCLTACSVVISPTPTASPTPAAARR